MKKLKFIAILALTLFLSNCEKEAADTLETSNTIVQHEISEETLSKISQMGYSTKDVLLDTDGQGYVVEGDIVIPKEAFDDFNIADNTASKSRWFAQHPLPCSAVRDIKIASYLPWYMHSALKTAMDNWNGLGKQVQFRLVNSGQDITIYSVAGWEINGKWGRASGPYWGRVGSTIRLNHDLNVTWEDWRTTIMHELGHCVGLAHTDTDFSGSTHLNDRLGAAGLCDKPDAESIMWGGKASPAMKGYFSTCDIRAIDQLYTWDTYHICY